MKSIVVLLATYNGGKYLRRQLDSLFKQTNQDFRLVVHDDGSTDDTIAILEEYHDKYPDRVEIIFGNPCGGPKANFMYLLSEIEADYYFLCDQDDVWLDNKIQKSVDALRELEENENNPTAVFTDMYVVDSELNTLSKSFIRYIGRDPKNIAYTQILIDNPAAGTTMCFNRALRDLAISCDSIQWENVPMHDSWLLELAAIFGKVGCIDEPLVYYRQTGANTMGANNETVAEKVSRNIRETSEGFFAKKKSFINEARLFAREVVRLKDIPEDKLVTLTNFIHIGTKPKLSRMRFYRENNFTRAHHNLWMRLWV
ncbi:MAG: glycosyltransferase family 2 protein [Pseudobutyrivibrio sp.]|nr:glycosyltransferase family 2 protein [Pseudobutyrivibrio sp.]